MNRAIKTAVFRAMSEVYGLSRGPGEDDFRLLLYHKICSDSKKLNNANLNRLKKQITSIKTRCLPDPASALEKIQKDSVSGIGLTFDDGYSELYSEVCPLLEELGVPYLLYLAPGFLGKRRGDYLSRTQVKELASWSGCFIGSHGMTHKNLKTCSISEARNEILTSKEMLEDLTGVLVKSFAYPFGSVTETAIGILNESSYTSAVTSRTGTNRLERQRFFLNRTEMSVLESERMFYLKTHGAFDWHRIRQKGLTRLQNQQ